MNGSASLEKDSLSHAARRGKFRSFLQPAEEALREVLRILDRIATTAHVVSRDRIARKARLGLRRGMAGRSQHNAPMSRRKFRLQHRLEIFQRRATRIQNRLPVTGAVIL